MTSKNHVGRRRITELQIKIDELQNTNRSLEQHIFHLQDNKEAVSSHVDVLTRKNEQLCKELTEIDKLAEQLEKDKDQVLDAAEQEVEDSKLEIRRQQRTIENLENTIKNLTSDAGATREHLEKAEVELEAKRGENRTLNILLDQLQEEKNRLGKKAEKLERSEKNVVLANEKSKTMTPSKLDCFIKTLEEEKDHYKREAENLRKMLRSRSGSPKRSPSQSVQFDPEFMKTARERDELQTMLEKYERHMAEIQGNVKVMTSERDKTNVLYDRAQQEITQLRRELMQSPKTSKANLTAQAILRRVETERDSAISDLRRMTTERDSLRERLKISQETAINDRAHLEQRIEELQSSIRTMENERLEHKSKLSLMKETISSVENEMKILTRRTMDTENELSRQKSECDSLRLLNDKTEHTLEETQRRLALKQNELQIAQEKIVRLEEKIAEQTSQSLSQREEISILKATLTELDKEKDILLYSVDQKTEKMSSLEETIAFKENTIQGLRDVISEMEDSARQSAKTLSSHEQEISRLRRQLDEISDELSHTGRDREMVVQENSRLHDQLSKSKLENQTLTHKLKDSQKELEDVKLKMQGTITDVALLESSIKSKEKENRDVMENYRRASSQAENWENKFRQVEGEHSSGKLELLSAESERRRLKERVDFLEMEIEQHITSEQSYKSQISSINKSIPKMEDELRQIKAEKVSVLNELASTRELCIKLDSNKEVINRQLCTRNQDMERLRNELESSRSEVELLRKQLASERISMKNLESLLVSNQEKEFHCQVQTQELDSEIQLLGEKLALAENKLGNQSREAAQLKNKITQQEADLEITRRHLSTERFERQVERAVKELRRQSYSYQTSCPLGKSLNPSRLSPDHSFRSPERRSKSPERTLDRSVMLRDF
ncbi:testis-specific gene 10 protein isoform X1 [Ascaphus truei]|uniref:testis-specific gene 10 protein isoform X1 n=1 Tax=Ascaphus truei TaxID=8439 RepID=UPI003F5A87FD